MQKPSTNVTLPLFSQYKGTRTASRAKHSFSNNVALLSARSGISRSLNKVVMFMKTCRYHVTGQGPNQLFILWWAIFMKFHSMTSSCLFNRGTTFSRTVTYNNNNVFLPADTKSIAQIHTMCTTLVNKNTQNRTFYNSVGG